MNSQYRALILSNTATPLSQDTTEDKLEQTQQAPDCLVPISVGMKSPQEQNIDVQQQLTAAMVEIAKKFHHINFIITDTLQQHNFEVEKELKPTDARDAALKNGKYWHDLVHNIAQEIMPDRYILTHWDEFKLSEDFNNKLALIKASYATDPLFEAAVRGSFNKRFTRLQTLSPSQAEASYSYVLEECAVFLIWLEKIPPNYKYIIYYQGEINEAILYLSRLHKRFHTPPVSWNAEAMYVRGMSPPHLKNMYGQIKQAFKANSYQNSDLLDHLLATGKAALKRDKLTFIDSAFTCGSFFLSRGAYSKARATNSTILDLAETHLFSAERMCQNELKLVSKKQKFIDFLSDPSETEPTIILDLREMYADLLLNLTSYHARTLTEKREKILEIIDKSIAAQKIREIRKEKAWIVAGAYYNSANLLIKLSANDLRDLEKALEYCNDHIKKTDWESSWYGRVKLNLLYARILRHQARQDPIHAAEKRAAALNYIESARQINLQTWQFVTDEYQTLIDIELGLLVLDAGQSNKTAINHFRNVEKIYGNYTEEQHNTHSMEVLAKAYYLLWYEYSKNNDVENSKKYWLKVKEINEKLYPQNHPYRKRIELSDTELKSTNSDSPAIPNYAVRIFDHPTNSSSNTAEASTIKEFKKL